MNAIANLAATPCADLGECLADLAVDALIDEAELSPKPALVRIHDGAEAVRAADMARQAGFDN
ncbi:hypothetical protein EIM02_29760, partial [Pseudomonas aeruginosa]